MTVPIATVRNYRQAARNGHHCRRDRRRMECLMPQQNDLSRSLIPFEPFRIGIVRAVLSGRTSRAVRIADAARRIGTAITTGWVRYAVRIVLVWVHIAPEISSAVIGLGVSPARTVGVSETS